MADPKEEIKEIEGQISELQSRLAELKGEEDKLAFGRKVALGTGM